MGALLRGFESVAVVGESDARPSVAHSHTVIWICKAWSHAAKIILGLGSNPHHWVSKSLQTCMYIFTEWNLA